MKNGFTDKNTKLKKEASLYTAAIIEEFLLNLAKYAEEYAKSNNKTQIKAEHIADTLDKVSLVLKIYPKRRDVTPFKTIKKANETIKSITKS